MKSKLALLLAGVALIAGIALASNPGTAAVETQVLNAAQSSEGSEAEASAASSDVAEPDAETAAAQETAAIGTALQAAPTTPETIIITDVPVRDGAIPEQAPEGFETGWDIEDVQLTYDSVTDELHVLVNSFGILGDPEGNGDPSAWAPEWDAVGLNGVDEPDLGGAEHVTVVLDLDQDGAGDLIAGVPQGRDISEFSINRLVPGTDPAPFFVFAFGEELTNNIGTVPTEAPTAANPDLEFTITNLSTLSAGDGRLDFGINAFAGSGVDGNIGEDNLAAAGSFIAVPIDADLGDQVFLDENNNGINDPGESGIPNVTVNLLDDTGALFDVTDTDANGNFGFVVPPGTFTVEFVAPDGLSPTSQFTGTDTAVDSNADPATGRSEPVTLAAGEQNLTIDAGLVEFVPAPGISIEKATNGQDADDAPGIELIVGETAEFTFVVSNTGNVPLADITVNDDVLGFICQITGLDVGGSETCVTTAVVTEGQVTNVATATGQPIDPETGAPIGDPISDDDPSNHVGVVPGPPCVADIRGPRLFAGDRVVWDTGYIAQAGSTLVVETEEPGGSPGQPNEQVYVFVGDVMYGPTPIDLGTIEIDVENTGRLSFVHYSVVTGDSSMPNSVELEFCGTGISIDQAPACETNVSGPRLHAGGQVEWQSGIVAEAGSTIRITTTEPGASPDQPNEQVWVRVGVQLFGPTPIGLGTLEFTAERGGEIEVLHFSRITGFDGLPNSVEFELCGTHLR